MTHGGGDVAAQAMIIDMRTVDLDLTKRVGDVRVDHARRTDDRQFAGQRIGASQTIDLALVGGAEDAKDQPVSLGTWRWDVFLTQEYRFAGAASHDGAA
jgi:hypothetical protein